MKHLILAVAVVVAGACAPTAPRHQLPFPEFPDNVEDCKTSGVKRETRFRTVTEIQFQCEGDEA